MKMSVKSVKQFKEDEEEVFELEDDAYCLTMAIKELTRAIDKLRCSYGR